MNPVDGRPRPVSRAAFLKRTGELIRRGEEIVASPSWEAFRYWILESDEFLESSWGRMHRYHLAWLNVGRDGEPGGPPLDPEAERRFVSSIAAAKLAVLRTMLTSVERHGAPELGR